MKAQNNKKILAVDIGNTNISFGVFQTGRIIKRFDINTRNYSFEKLKYSLGNIVLTNSIICSVVPRMVSSLKRDLGRFLVKPPFVVGTRIKIPIKNLYRNPKMVGQDRLVNAYAAIKLYGAPLIVVDFGTAITFDVVTRKKEYLGGMILPGLGISLDALAERTALLPKIRLDKPKEFIGRDTRTSMLSGIIYGFAAMVDNLTKRIKDKIGRNAKVIGTGGNISLMGDFCDNIDKIDSNLTLKGLEIIYNDK